MNVLFARLGSKFSQFYFFLLIFVVALSGSTTRSEAQTAPTNVQVSGTVLQTTVHRLGVNLGDNGYYDSAQMLKNLVFENPGFEGLQYRVIFKCSVVTGNTCQDDNQWNGQLTGFWNGGTYLVLSGNAAGTTGKVVSQVGASTCKSCGPVFTFDQNVNLTKGDFFSVSTYVPGAGDTSWATDTGGGGAITTKTTDLSPNTPGKQAMLMSASGAGQYAKLTEGFETWQNLSFIQLNGAFEVTFRAKGMGGNNQLAVSVQRLQGTNAPYLNKTLTLRDSDIVTDIRAVQWASPGRGAVLPCKSARLGARLLPVRRRISLRIGPLIRMM